MDNVVDRFFEVTVSADRLVFAFDWLAVAAKSWIIKSPGYIAVAQRLIDSQECDLQWPDILSAIQISKSRLEGHFIEVPKARGRTTHHLPKIDDPFFDSAYRECRHIWIFRIVSTLFWAEFYCMHFRTGKTILPRFSNWIVCQTCTKVERIATKDMFLETVEKKERKKKRTQIIGCVSLVYL